MIRCLSNVSLTFWTIYIFSTNTYISKLSSTNSEMARTKSQKFDALQNPSFVLIFQHFFSLCVSSHPVYFALIEIVYWRFIRFSIFVSVWKVKHKQCAHFTCPKEFFVSLMIHNTIRFIQYDHTILLTTQTLWCTLNHTILLIKIKIKLKWEYNVWWHFTNNMKCKEVSKRWTKKKKKICQKITNCEYK